MATLVLSTGKPGSVIIIAAMDVAWHKHERMGLTRGSSGNSAVIVAIEGRVVLAEAETEAVVEVAIGHVGAV